MAHGIFQIRDPICILKTGRQILNHWTTSKVQRDSLNNFDWYLHIFSNIFVMTAMINYVIRICALMIWSVFKILPLVKDEVNSVVNCLWADWREQTDEWVSHVHCYWDKSGGIVGFLSVASFHHVSPSMAALWFQKLFPQGKLKAFLSVTETNS